MQHSEANMQAGDSRIPEDLMHLLDELSGRVHQTRSCKRCGAVMTLFGAVFFLENGNRSWNIPLPICPRCEPTMEKSTYMTSKAA